jgi:hypothetical protein
MTDARLYAKIMRHLETTSTGFWDFRTLNYTHPQLAGYVGVILKTVAGVEDPWKHYLPRRLWAWESEVTA